MEVDKHPSVRILQVQDIMEEFTLNKQNLGHGHYHHHKHYREHQWRRFFMLSMIIYK